MGMIARGQNNGLYVTAMPAWGDVLSTAEIRGIVASCQSFAQTMLAALVAGVIAPILDTSVLWLALGQLGFTVAGLSFWLAGRSYRRKSAYPSLNV